MPTNFVIFKPALIGQTSTSEASVCLTALCLFLTPVELGNSINPLGLKSIFGLYMKKFVSSEYIVHT